MMVRRICRGITNGGDDRYRCYSGWGWWWNLYGSGHLGRCSPGTSSRLSRGQCEGEQSVRRSQDSCGEVRKGVGEGHAFKSRNKHNMNGKGSYRLFLNSAGGADAWISYIDTLCLSQNIHLIGVYASSHDAGVGRWWSGWSSHAWC